MEKNTQVTKRKSSSVEQFSSKPFFARIDSQIMQRHFFTACSVSFSSSSILVCSSIARCEKRVSVRYLFFFLPPTTSAAYFLALLRLIIELQFSVSTNNSIVAGRCAVRQKCKKDAHIEQLCIFLV